jgi:hypothetical protein
MLPGRDATAIAEMRRRFLQIVNNAAEISTKHSKPRAIEIWPGAMSGDILMSEFIPCRSIPMVAQTSPEEIARCGEAIYERDIRPKVESDHFGEFVIVDILTGEYEVARDDLTASHRMLARNPEAVMYGIRIGSTAAYRIGEFGTDRHA